MNDGHRKRISSKTLFRVEIFKNTGLSFTCWRMKTEVFEYIRWCHSIVSKPSLSLNLPIQFSIHVQFSRFRAKFETKTNISFVSALWSLRLRNRKVVTYSQERNVKWQRLMVSFSSDSSFTLGCCYFVTRCPTVLENDRSFMGLQCKIRAIRTKYSLLYQTYALTARVSIYESMSWYILFPTSFYPFCPDWVAERCFLSWTLYSSTATGRAKYRRQSG